MTESKTSVSWVWWILFFIFLTLKLCKIIDWSWWWVTAPLWGGYAILAVLFLIYGIFKYLEWRKK